MISTADLKDALRIKAGVTAFDSRLATLESAAVAYLEEVTLRRWSAVGSRRASMNGPSDGPLWLVEEPVAVSKVEVRDRPGSEWEELEPEDYLVEGRQLWPTSGSWVRGTRNYRVTWSAGFAAGEEPVRVRQAVTDLVRFWFRQPDQGVASQEMKDLAVSYFATNVSELPPTVSEVLRLYKPRVPMERPEELAP